MRLCSFHAGARIAAMVASTSIERSRRPHGVTIIAVVLSVAAVLLLIPGLALCLPAVKINLGLELETAGQNLAWHPDRARLIAFCVVNGGILAALAIGLFRLRNWARIAGQVLLGISMAIGVLISLPPPRPKMSDGEAELAFLVITGLAIWYLRRPAVINHFKRVNPDAPVYS
jgi:hypothetical protein